MRKIAVATLIEIDGIDRSRMNGNGIPIHPTDEGIKNFWRWFGESVLIDTEGRPLSAYHGTKGDFDVFATPAWFTDKEDFADLFSADWGPGCGGGQRTADSRVITAYLSIRSPFKTAQWSVTEDLAYDPVWVAERKAEGYDGVIFELDGETEYIVFDASQIKSIVSNAGDFSLTSDSIYDAQAMDLVENSAEDNRAFCAH